MKNSRIYPLIGAMIGVVIGFVVIFLLENRKGILPDENLLDLAIIGGCVGASIGAFADMLGKGEKFTDSMSGIIGSIVYGAAIGSVLDIKFSQPILRAIAGAIVAIIAFVLYHKVIVGFIIKKKRDVDPLLYAIFGVVIGAICGACVLIVDTIYSSIYLRSVIEGNGYSISNFIEDRRKDMGFGIIIGGVLGTIFCLVLGVIHNLIRGKGAAGGAIVGSIVLGEIFQSFTGFILGVFAGAIISEVLSKGRMKSVITGATIVGSAGLFISAVGWFAIIPIQISLRLILPAVLIIGYYEGMNFMNKYNKY